MSATPPSGSSAEKNGSFADHQGGGRTPSPAVNSSAAANAILDPTRPDVIPKSAPMNHPPHIPFSAAAAVAAASAAGGVSSTGSPLDLSANPFSLFMSNPFGMLGGAAAAAAAGNPLLPHLAAAAAAAGKASGGGIPPVPPMPGADLGLILPPNSLALTGKKLNFF